MRVQERCRTCDYRRMKYCFMCAHYDDREVCEGVCVGKRMFETEKTVCPECGARWDEEDAKE